MSGIPSVNGIRHSYASAKFHLFGKTHTGVSAIEYSISMAVEDHPASNGHYPADRGLGVINATGSITLRNYVLNEISKAAGGIPLPLIPEFDVTVTYVTAGDKTVTDILRNCRFTEDKRGGKAGDTMLEAQIGLKPSHIDFNYKPA